MVKKLYKHEILAWLRVLTVIYSIILAVAALHRIIQCFENDSVSYSIIIGSATFMYVIALLSCIAAPVVFGVVRFHKNLFSGEGYLTLTLPVTTSAHLLVKVTTAVMFSIASVLVCLLSVLIITAGDVFGEVCKAISYLWSMIPTKASGHVAGYCIEILFLLLIQTFTQYLLYDTCICTGQLFRKNRILAAVGVYFGIYVISQILGTISSVFFVVLEPTGFLEQIMRFMQKHPYGVFHIALCGSAVLSAVMGLLYYLICHHILNKKLNLE